MKTIKSLLLLATLATAIGVTVGSPDSADAAFRAYRQRYSSWSYYPTRQYYYRSYYYKPYADYEGYNYHYCIHDPTRPTYVYYYNPHSSQYWGRYDLEAKGYSMLAEKDRKANLDEIPEEAFPKPGKMPAIPESKDGESIDPIEADDLPKGEAPKDVPNKK